MDRTRLDEHISALCGAILRIEDEAQCRAFLDDICTYKEVEQMAMRLYAAEMFLNGSTYTDIINETELSSATLSRVSRALTHGSGGYRAVLGRKDNDK